MNTSILALDIITYVTLVEGLVTRIKMESSNQHKSWSRDQDKLQATKITGSTHFLRQ